MTPAKAVRHWPKDHPLTLLAPPEEAAPEDPPSKSSGGFHTSFVPSGVGNGLAWINQLGGPSTDVGMSAAATSQAVYVAGSSDGGFDVNTSNGLNDFIIAKFSSNSAKLWSKQLGTTGQDYATAIATYTLSSPHAIYVAGYSTGSMDGSPKVGTASDAVLVKLDENGNKLWVRQLDSPTHAAETVFGVATDKFGNVYFTGTTTGSLNGTPNLGGTDIFLAKYSSTGVKQWVQQLGTNKNEVARGVATDSEGNIYVGGHTFGGMGGANQDPAQLTSDLVLLKFDPSGTLLWKKQLGTNKNESISGVVTSRQLNNAISIYVVGYSNAAFDGQVWKGGYDAIMVKFDKSGNKQWSRQVGTAGTDIPNGVASDGGANLYVVGRTDHDMDTNILTGDKNIFLTKHDANGSLQFTKQLGSINLLNPTSTDDEGLGVAADINDGLYVVGATFGEFSNPATTNGGNNTSDLLVAKYTVGCQDTFTANQCSIGYGWGDPHLVTFDRRSYDFQGAGEFVLTESTTGDPFKVQVRQQPWGSSPYVTVMTAIATQVGTDRVGFYQGSTALKINGAPTVLAVGDLVPLPGGGRLYRQDSTTYVVYYPDADRMIVSNVGGSYMNANFSLPLSRKGLLRGLLGNFNDNPADDFILRNGTSLGASPSFAQLYTSTQSLAASWRLTQDESLFDYDPGQSTSTFTQVDFPSMPVSTWSLPPAQLEQAQLICKEAGVGSPVLLDNCALDVAVTEDTSFAAGAAQTQVQEDQGGAELPPPAVGPQTAYFAHFNETVGEEWSPASQALTPEGDRIFLGEYGEQQVNLNWNKLPPHSTVTVSFDLLLLQAWDGDGPYGPNIWGFSVDDKPFFDSTFSNTNSSQSYPKKGSKHGTGADLINRLGYANGDSLYKMKFTFDHTSPELQLGFFSKGLSGLTGEAWGLDSVEIQVQ